MNQQQKLHIRFQRQKNDLIGLDTKEIVLEIYTKLLKQISNKSDYDEFIYYALEESVQKGFYYAIQKQLTIDTEVNQVLTDIGIFVIELYEKEISIPINDLSDQSFYKLKNLQLLSSIERGFFYGYILSGKAIPKKKKNNIFKLPLTGTTNN